ncbi:hypothetical protein [Pontibacter mangrovi]|uniref:Uncharacterized protein n=1 Tax=Pontibacter mangrovi TaxID=2589816 RepID=A0A501W779_9BACT|nr:hypothetical protein [Pontibacter mangrovi]TPE44180.1 hypothetical protein FJM65_08410 [Pontibacter mangrovi]
MKTLLTISLLFLQFTGCLGQQPELDFTQIRLKGLAFNSTRSAIEQAFGQPRSTIEPNYDCGYFSAREQGKKFEQLRYDQVVFIGNPEDGYSIESVVFNDNGTLALQYGKYKLNQHTTWEDFLEIFGQEAQTKQDDSGDGRTRVLLLSRESEDGLMFSFRHGRLYKVAYWSPC